jgi:hypothetical protein
MKKIQNTSALFIAFAVLTLSSCKKDEETKPTNVNPGPITISMDHRAGNRALDFETDFVTANGDTVRFSTFNYYISNIELVREDGSVYVVPKDKSYFLVKEQDEASKEITLDSIPAGTYTGINFVIGVDSAKSVSDISERTGVLDPVTGAAGMYWTWNSGYIFMKVEGTSPQIARDSTGAIGSFYYHVGGFGGYSSPTINNLKKVSLAFPSAYKATVNSGSHPEVHVVANILEMFTTPTTFSVADHPMVMFAPFSTTISANYADMFRVDHVHND